MRRYRLRFYGRVNGALGLNSMHVVEVEAESFEGAALKAYDTHEHISHPLSVTDVETRESREVSP